MSDLQKRADTLATELIDNPALVEAMSDDQRGQLMTLLMYPKFVYTPPSLMITRMAMQRGIKMAGTMQRVMTLLARLARTFGVFAFSLGGSACAGIKATSFIGTLIERR